MATEKNITMKQFNGTDYDTLYPKTIASQIPDVYSKSYIDSILKNNARIQTGSYVGTGTYGANNPCTLTFDFLPIIITIYMEKSTTGNYGIFLWGKEENTPSSTYVVYPQSLTNDYIKNLGFTMPSNSLSHEYYAKREGNTIFWYDTNSGAFQANRENYTYYWVAIG